MAGLLGAGASYNAATGRRYKGINTLRLSMLADERGYKDPRWCTFRSRPKIRAIRKGEHATKVEYWAMYDMERKRWMNWNEVERLKRMIPMQPTSPASAAVPLSSLTPLRWKASRLCPSAPGQTLVNSASSGTPCWRICSWPIGRRRHPCLLLPLSRYGDAASGGQLRRSVQPYLHLSFMSASRHRPS